MYGQNNSVKSAKTLGKRSSYGAYQKLSRAQFQKMDSFPAFLENKMNFGVIGAGIIGLTTALQLQEEFPNSKITIFADQFNEDTTSWVAAGVFRPSTSFMGPSLDITKKWVLDAYNYWDDIRKKSDAPKAGIAQLSGYIFSKTSKSIVQNHLIEKIVPVYRDATEEELSLCYGNWKYGSFFTTLLIESGRFLPYGVEKFRQNGGVIKQNRIESFRHIDNKFDIILNCAGLGAKELCNDHLLVPIRGQVIKVRAPWIKTAFYGDFDTYIIPGFDTVTLGGCRQYESYNREISKYDSLSIRERCCEMLPSLQKAETIRELVGLRPHRHCVRVEPEFLERQGGSHLKIVHNYGHGGYGVTTAPGTAKYAVKLVRDIHGASGKSKI